MRVVHRPIGSRVRMVVLVLMRMLLLMLLVLELLVTQLLMLHLTGEMPPNGWELPTSFEPSRSVQTSNGTPRENPTAEVGLKRDHHTHKASKGKRV